MDKSPFGFSRGFAWNVESSEVSSPESIPFLSYDKERHNPARRELAGRGPATAGTLVGAGDGHGVGNAAHRGSKLQPTSCTDSPVSRSTPRMNPTPRA